MITWGALRNVHVRNVLGKCACRDRWNSFCFIFRESKGRILIFFFWFSVFFFLSYFSDRWKLCVHFEEPLIQASCRNISGTADGNRWTWWITLWWCQWKRHREFRVLGKEEEEKEITRSGNESYLQLCCEQLKYPSFKI